MTRVTLRIQDADGTVETYEAQHDHPATALPLVFRVVHQAVEARPAEIAGLRELVLTLGVYTAVRIAAVRLAGHRR